jgi:hypothetical protein
MDIEEETTNIKTHIDKGNYHAGINRVTSTMNACGREENQEGVDYLLNMMKDIVNTMTDEFGSKS